MEKRKRWQFILITVVILLTIYNILPTVLFYSKPLKEPIGEKKAYEVAYQAASRVNQLETETVSWLKSYNKLLKTKAKSIKIDEQNPELVHLEFESEKDANTFKSHIPRAGALIPFVPAQLALTEGSQDALATEVTLQRNIPIQFDTNNLKTDFKFVEKKDANGEISPQYHELIDDRLMQLGLSIGGTSENAAYVETILHQMGNPRSEEFLQILSHNILAYSKIFGENSPIAKRYFATFTQGNISNRSDAIAKLTKAFESNLDKIKLERIHLQETEKNLRDKGGFLETADAQKLDYLRSREDQFFATIQILRRQSGAFSQGTTPWSYPSLTQLIGSTYAGVNAEHPIQTIQVGDHNPLIKNLSIDWNSEKILLELHPDIQALRKELEREKGKSHTRDQLDQLIYNEVARISRESGEQLSPYRNAFQIDLNTLASSESLLVMDIGSLAEEQAKQMKNLISSQWHPSHPDLRSEVFPIFDFATYEKLPNHQKKLGLVIYAPAADQSAPQTGFRTNSVYVIAKGVQDIIAKLQSNPNSPQAKAFMQDFEKLRMLLHQSGFYGYPGTTYPLSGSFANDFIFEAEDFYQTILMATREDFKVHGTRRFATLEFTNVEQRIYALNRIETQMHEDLLKWRDEYQAAQVKTQLDAKFDVPAPTKSPLLNNLALSFRKYFRGDERKILHWGLDLSGGKTVQIELRDVNNRVVTNEDDIKQGINELYNRVNKMGVSEVTIRQEGNHITLDFPSAQGLSAADLVKASSMYFHVVNEKFSTENRELRTSVNQFLQDVWNEAVVTNRKDIDSINMIAWKHLFGDTLDTESVQPVSESAKTLYDQGLRLGYPGDAKQSSAFNDTLSKIAIYRGDSFSEWHGQTHPLMIVMNNYALEGANLIDVHAAYDPSQGNFLTFNVKSSQTLADGQKTNPRNDLYNWTSAFSKEKISGTALGSVTNGRGWRMAVILNGSVISAPAIESGLRDHVSITGSFTQREANRLEADLKAGSLSFAPHILSEKNVSPELGLKDRAMGIIATIVALALVILMMVGYYRFAGVVASIAVLFNLLIMWATLQNIQATVTLAGIAGIILTVGMAVDANVLVFERIREEFASAGRIASAVHTGYRKAFSAILDSNITTIIAALILLHFDSGPIKGFAITLIIGIVSSMFSALFMTRYFFAGWVKNPTNQALKMASLIKKTSINFLKYGKWGFSFSLIIALVGAYLFVSQRNTMLGMDFTGGYSLSVEVEPKADANYRSDVEAALVKAGLSPRDFQVRELSPTNHLKILLSNSLDQSGKPFEYLPFETDQKDVSFAYENNPRLVWVVGALVQGGLEVTPTSLKQLDSSWTSISGQMSNAMRNNALIGLSLALICILLYITFRFEFKYAISATLGLAIDVVITLAVLTILHTLGVPIQIDLNTIAALMTIIGYSLNDTIIIFDRIREDLKSMRKHSFKDVINHALNVTLSRTVMTSGTTLVVLLALLFLGGSTIFGLSLVMVIGVVFGTLSSLYIAAPLLLFFHRKEQKKNEKLALNEK